MTKAGVSPDVGSWSRRFFLLGDSNRLTLLLLIHRTGPIRMADLVRATGRSRDAVVQTLRLLRDHGAITGRRCEGTALYELADGALAGLLGYLEVDDSGLTISLTTARTYRTDSGREIP